MKIYRVDNRIVLIGKAWEIRTKLKEYGSTYSTVLEWLNDMKGQKRIQ